MFLAPFSGSWVVLKIRGALGIGPKPAHSGQVLHKPNVMPTNANRADASPAGAPVASGETPAVGPVLPLRQRNPALWASMAATMAIAKASTSAHLAKARARIPPTASIDHEGGCRAFVLDPPFMAFRSAAGAWSLDNEGRPFTGDDLARYFRPVSDELAAELAAEARAALQPPSPKPVVTYYVSIVDFGSYGDGPSCISYVEGFESPGGASEYAKRRTRDSVEELRQPGQSPADLRTVYAIYGESCFAHQSDVPGPIFVAHDHVQWFIDHPATPEQRDYSSLEPPRAVTRTA